MRNEFNCGCHNWHPLWVETAGGAINHQYPLQLLVLSQALAFPGVELCQFLLLILDLCVPQLWVSAGANQGSPWGGRNQRPREPKLHEWQMLIPGFVALAPVDRGRSAHLSTKRQHLGRTIRGGCSSSNGLGVSTTDCSQYH